MLSRLPRLTVRLARAVPVRAPTAVHARTLLTDVSMKQSTRAKPEGERRKRRTKAALNFSAEPMYKNTASIAEEDAPFCHSHLPHPATWKQKFSFTKDNFARHRYFVSRQETAKEIVSKIGLDDPSRAGRKATVVEAYAGPGTLTRELMQHPNVERVVALENVPTFLPCLEELKVDPTLEGNHDKLHILPQSGFVWDTYETLINDGYLSNLENQIPNLGPNAPPMDWEATSPLVFVAQIPNTVHGEQLFAQLVHAISSGFWLFQYGRVKMVFVCGETVATRALATPANSRDRAKLGTTVQCLSTPELLISSDQLQPYGDYFYPPTPSIGPRVPITNTFIPNANISSGLSKRNLAVLSIDPLKHLLVKSRDLDAFEFLTRNLFVLKTKPISEALKHVAPGAANILKMLAPDRPGMQDRPHEVILPDTPVVQLTNEQWAALAVVFEKWPFRPQNLFEEGRVTRGNGADKQFF